MKKLKSLSVGIPAYNEEANIKKLLTSILGQVESGYSLIEIIVISDGSTDMTATEVRKLKSRKIKLINNMERSGKSFRINQIFQMFKGDILLLLDADITIADKSLFTKIVKNNDFTKSGLLGINATPKQAENTFQQIMNSGTALSEQISYSWNNGQNYLAFKGCFLGLSRHFAKQVKLKSHIINNDAYLYFKALDLGFSPVFYKEAYVFYKSPRHFSDYLGQTKRFAGSKKEMEKLFKKDLSYNYAIPKSVRIKAILKNLFLNPFLLGSYIIVKGISIFIKPANVRSTWNIAVSTK